MKNREGDVVTSNPDTIGIPVGGKISFTIASGTRAGSHRRTKCDSG